VFNLWADRGRVPRRAFARKISKLKTKSPLNKRCSKIFSFNDVSPHAAMQEEMGRSRVSRNPALGAQLAWHRSHAASKRLDDLPGVGPALAFRSGRDFSTWIGLVPKQRSSGGKDKLGSISKQGDRYLRSLFTAGALAVIRYAKIHGTQHRPWLSALFARRPTKVAAIVLANKIARMSWAIMARGERQRTRRTRSVNEIAPTTRRDVKVGRANST
jgi:hypothetical protein